MVIRIGSNLMTEMSVTVKWMMTRYLTVLLYLTGFVFTLKILVQHGVIFSACQSFHWKYLQCIRLIIRALPGCIIKIILYNFNVFRK